jgi:hypothetical protein
MATTRPLPPGGPIPSTQPALRLPLRGHGASPGTCTGPRQASCRLGPCRARLFAVLLLLLETEPVQAQLGQGVTLVRGQRVPDLVDQAGHSLHPAVVGTQLAPFGGCHFPGFLRHEFDPNPAPPGLTLRRLRPGHERHGQGRPAGDGLVMNPTTRRTWRQPSATTPSPLTGWRPQDTVRLKEIGQT